MSPLTPAHFLFILFAGWFALVVANILRRRRQAARTGWVSPLGGPWSERQYLKARGFPREWLGLVRALRTDDAAARETATRRLLQEGRVMLPMLRAFCRDEGDAYRRAVLEVIGRLHPEGVAAGLAEGLRSGEPHEEMMSCDALGALGAEGASEIPALVEFAYSDGIVSDRAFTALARMGVPGALATLDRFARHEIDPTDAVVPLGLGEVFEEAVEADDAAGAAAVVAKVLEVGGSPALSPRARGVLASALVDAVVFEDESPMFEAVAADANNPFAPHARILVDCWACTIDDEEAYDRIDAIENRAAAQENGLPGELTGEVSR